MHYGIRQIGVVLFPSMGPSKGRVHLSGGKLVGLPLAPQRLSVWLGDVLVVGAGALRWW